MRRHSEDKKKEREEDRNRKTNRPEDRTGDQGERKTRRQQHSSPPRK